MDQQIIYPLDNGGVAVIIPAPECGWTIEEIAAKDVPAGKSFAIVDVSDIPTDSTFRDAWEYADKIVINIDKAKEITKTRLRTERAPLLQNLDIAFQRALETGADTSTIVAEKQRLRDITNAVDTCATLDELRTLKVE